MPGNNLEACFERPENNFDFLRMFFACLVIYSHSYSTADGTYLHEPLSSFSHEIATFGSLSVGAFFIISGALITRSMLSGRSVKRFCKRRAARLFPGYIVASAVCLLLFTVVTRDGSNAIALARRMILLDRPISPAVWPHNPYPFNLNGSVWTIKYELACYVMVGILGVLAMLRWSIALPLFFIATLIPALDSRWHFVPASVWPRLGPLPLFAFFLAGMVGYLGRRWIPMSGLLFAACVAALVALWHFARLADGVAVQPILFSYIVLYVAFSRSLPLAHFGRFGDFSYGTYLYAFPIQQTIVWRFPNIHPVPVFFLALPVTIAVAVVSWRLVEKPFLHRRPRATAPDADASDAVAKKATVTP